MIYENSEEISFHIETLTLHNIYASVLAYRIQGAKGTGERSAFLVFPSPKNTIKSSARSTMLTGQADMLTGTLPYQILLTVSDYHGMVGKQRCVCVN